MAKLWEKGYKLNEAVESFTVGEDPILDTLLIKADIIGTIAHAKGLEKIGILKEEDVESIRKALLKIIKDKGFTIKVEDEDVHTRVENYLVEELGPLGKKIHAGRSRNDQIILDLRLYSKEKLFEIQEKLFDFASTLLSFATRYQKTPMVGRTHFRPAMPSSLGLWAGAFLEAIMDDGILLEVAYRLNDQSPLGAAAGYGTALSIDREFTSKILGFSKLQNNLLYVNNSRGKVEGVILSALSHIMGDLSRLATDIILFSTPEFGYFDLPDELCSGSSLMPQKKNPDVLELIRARAEIVTSFLFEVFLITSSLPTGYNRDLQETKAPLMRGLEITCSCLEMADLVMRGLTVNEEKMLEGFRAEIFAADKAVELAKKGIPFRDAYRMVAEDLDGLERMDPKENILKKTIQGGPGNLRLELSERAIEEGRELLKKRKSKYYKAISSLLGIPYPIS
jgi:argininosuccinate lyase